MFFYAKLTISEAGYFKQINNKKMKYKCKCGEFEVRKTTIVIVNGEVVKKESYCKDCKTYGKEIKTFNGWGTIVSKKGGKV